MKYKFCALFTIFLSSIVFADDALKTNGCGPDGWGLLIPNRTLISSCDFLKGCNAHDLCYGRCLNKGELSGPTCTNEKEKADRKRNCDLKLQSDINTDNKNRPICSMYASLYHLAVSNIGTSYFKGIEASHTDLIKLNQFIRYIEDNPNSFNYNDLETSFEAINSTHFKPGKYYIDFESYIPWLHIFSFDVDNNLVHNVDIKGISHGTKLIE